MRVSRRLLGAAVGLAAGVLASAALAVDMTGRWLVTDQNILIGETQYLLDVVQTGSSLTVTFQWGGSNPGSIDPVTGAFTFHVPAQPSPFPMPDCSGITFEGTVSQDEQSFLATYTGTFFKLTPPSGCFGFSGGLTGVPSHCGDGVLDAGEECDDGNNGARVNRCVNREDQAATFSAFSFTSFPLSNFRPS